MNGGLHVRIAHDSESVQIEAASSGRKSCGCHTFVCAGQIGSLTLNAGMNRKLICQQIYCLMQKLL